MFTVDTSRSGWLTGGTFSSRAAGADELTDLLAQGFRRFAIWGERIRQRRELGRLDDRMLSDIGLSRVDADREVNKIFWQA